MISTQKTDYFDFIVDARTEGADWIAALGDFNHWGYWADPDRARSTLDEMESSQQMLTDELLSHAALEDGQQVLDVGCGLGGTLRTIDGQYHNMRLFGLDHDSRLVDITTRNVLGLGENQVQIQQGCATRLPFEDASMDVITAVECVFHFPSRAAFLAEARRVLRPGGRLVMTDFLIARLPKWVLRRQQVLAKTPALNWLGKLDFITQEQYQQLSEQAGFFQMETRDITRNTLPTYPCRIAFFKSTHLGLGTIGPRIAGMHLAKAVSRAGVFKCEIITMTKGPIAA